MTFFLKNKLQKVFLILFLFLNSINFSTLIKSQEFQEKQKVAQELQIQSENYLLGPGDIIQISILDFPENPTINRRMEVLNNGGLQIPFIGLVNIEGLTIDQAKQLITEKLSRELIRPDIELYLIRQRNIRFTIAGEVQMPGFYTFKSAPLGNQNLNATLVAALQKAGGITQEADISNIIMTRKLPGGKGERKLASIDLTSLIFDGNMSQNPVLQDGDFINVHKSSNESKKAALIRKTNLSPTEISVYVVGEVKKPGMIKLRSNTPLVQGVLAAGGPVAGRSNADVELIRVNNKGSVIFKKYKLDFTQKNTDENNPILNNGDTIRIKRNSFAVATDSIGTLSAPFRDVITVWSFFRLIND